MKPYSKLLIITGVILLFHLLTNDVYSQTEAWVAPIESASLENPVKGDTKALKKGQDIYFRICASCHGKTGVGDGKDGLKLNPKPADHTSEKVQSQKDGEIYWKITNGRGEMPNYMDLLSKTQRWQVLEFVRTLKKK